MILRKFFVKSVRLGHGGTDFNIWTPGFLAGVEK